MLTLVPIVLLIAAGLFILFAEKLKLAPGKVWLVATLSGFTVWTILFLIKFFHPARVAISTQITQTGIPAFTAFAFTPQNWIFAFLLVTFMLAVIFAEAGNLIREDNVYISNLAGALIFTGVGLLSIIANSDRAFATAWGLLDLIELSILFLIVREPGRQRTSIAYLFWRISGLAILFLLMALKGIGEDIKSLAGFRNPIMIVILLTVSLRSGILTKPQKFALDQKKWFGASLLLRLIPATTAFAFLSYSMPLPNVNESQAFLVLVISGIVLLSAIKWINCDNVQAGHQAWQLAIVSMAIIAAIENRLGVLFALSVLLTMITPLLSYPRTQNAESRWFLLLPISSFLLLPFSPSSPIRELIAGESFSLTALFLGTGFLLLIFGAIRQVLEHNQVEGEKENWMRFFQVLGILLLSITSWLTGLFYFVEIRSSQYWWLSVGFIAITVVLFFIGKDNRKKPLNPLWENPITRSILKYVMSDSLVVGIKSLIAWNLRWIRSLLGLVQEVLEGNGGIFWSLLFLAILASLLMAEQVP